MRRISSPFLKAVLWFILCITVGCFTNALLKYMGANMDPFQVNFYRCFLSVVTLLPFVFYQGPSALVTHFRWLHLVRGMLFAVATSCWTYGIQKTPIAIATLVSFMTPLFVLLLAPIFLKERVTRAMWIATLLSFGGIWIVLQPNQDPSIASLLLVLSSALFGFLDVLNKKQVAEASILQMIFYSTCFSTLLLAPFMLAFGSLPTTNEVGILLGLGLGNNLLLYCLLRAFTLARAASLAPFRYLELPIAMIVGYIVFQELPESRLYLGAAIIIPGTLFAMYQQEATD